MTFFPQSEKADPQIEEWALRLRNAVKKHSQVKFSKTIWNRAFIKLRKIKGEKRVEEILSWFEQHVGEEFVPSVISAESFRAKFGQIEAAMLRDGSEEVELEYRERAKGLLLRLDFPVEIATRLSALVKRTTINWTAFCKGMTNTQDRTNREIRFIHHVISNYYGSFFVSQWFANISQNYGNHEHYTGPVMNLAFMADSKRFKESFWHLWSFQWCHDAKAFDDLLNKIVDKL